MYRNLKTSFHKEEYLNCLWHYPYRRILACLRLSSHKLHIETGRHLRGSDRLPPESRLCRQCDLNTCENEFHFVIICPKYEKNRKDLVKLLAKKYPLINLFSSEELYIWFMCNVEPYVLIQFAKYIHSSFSTRQNSIDA